MVPRSVLPSAIALGLLVFALPAHAQRRPGAEPDQQTPEVLPPPTDSGDTGTAAEVPEKSAPQRPAAGYAYAEKPVASRAAARARYRTHGPVVNMPGFEQTADGGSRLFVQLSQSVPVEERKAQNSVTYVLKGASPRVYNNTNALVTVHFNTPVTRARLVPQGKDLLFVVELRAPVTPTWAMNEGDKGATLTIDFPKGDFLQAGTEAAPPAEPGAARPSKPARSQRGRVKPAAVKRQDAPAADPKP